MDISWLVGLLLKGIVYLFWLLSWWGAECTRRKLARWLSVVCSRTHETRLISLLVHLPSSLAHIRAHAHHTKGFFTFLHTEGLIWHYTHTSLLFFTLCSLCQNVHISCDANNNNNNTHTYICPTIIIIIITNKHQHQGHHWTSNKQTNKH